MTWMRCHVVVNDFYLLLNNPPRKNTIPSDQIPICILGPIGLVNPITEKINPRFIIGLEKLGLILFFFIRINAVKNTIAVIIY